MSAAQTRCVTDASRVAAASERVEDRAFDLHVAPTELHTPSAGSERAVALGPAPYRRHTRSCRVAASRVLSAQTTIAVGTRTWPCGLNRVDARPTKEPLRARDGEGDEHGPEQDDAGDAWLLDEHGLPFVDGQIER